MFRRLKILVLLQLSNQSRVVEKHLKRIYRYLALRLLTIVLLTVVFGLLLHVIKNIIYIPVNEYFLISILMITQLLNIVSSTIGLTTDIYQSKDNQILLTLPTHNDEIFYSKIILYYWYEFKKNLYIILPFIIAYGALMNMSWIYYINLVPVMVILPCISVLLATLLSTLFTFIEGYIKKHPWLLFTLLISLIVFIFLAVYYLVSLIPDHIRIVELYHSFIVGLTRFLQAFATYGTVYTWIGKLMNGMAVFMFYLSVIGVILGLVILTYVISRPLFFYLTSHSTEISREKTHRTKHERPHPLFWTFFKKELIITLRSPNEILNNYAILLFLPMIMYALNTIYMGMNRSSFGNLLVIVFNILIVLLLITASSSASSVSITTEGYEFILIKTSPSKAKQIAWAKMTFNFILTSILLAISFILFAVALPTFSQSTILYLFIFSFFFNGAQILWAFQIDVMHPQLSEYAQTGSLSHISNITKALSNGFLISIAFTIVSVFMLLIISQTAWFILIGCSVLWFLFRLTTFNAYLNAFFTDIEY